MGRREGVKREGVEINMKSAAVRDLIQGSDEIWPVDSIETLDPEQQRLRIASWVEGMRWAIRRGPGNKEISAYLRGDLNEHLPEGLRYHPNKERALG